MVPIGSKITLVVGTVDNANVNGEATVTLQTTPPDLPGTVNVTAVLNGETVYSEVIEPRNTRLISIPLQGSGTCMADGRSTARCIRALRWTLPPGSTTGRPTILRPLVSKWRG